MIFERTFLQKNGVLSVWPLFLRRISRFEARPVTDVPVSICNAHVSCFTVYSRDYPRAPSAEITHQLKLHIQIYATLCPSPKTQDEVAPFSPVSPIFPENGVEDPLKQSFGLDVSGPHSPITLIKLGCHTFTLSSPVLVTWSHPAPVFCVLACPLPRQTAFAVRQSQKAGAILQY